MGWKPLCCRYVTSKHRADNFAADIGIAGGMVGHHAFGRRQDRDPEAVIDTRQCLDRGVDTPAGLGDARNLADHRLAVEIFQLDLELAAAVGMRHGGIAANIALGLEHLADAFALLGARHGNLRLGSHLRVADAGYHVANRIVDTHFDSPTSLISRGRESGPWNRDRAKRYG